MLLFVSRDLFFISKVTGTAAAVGLKVATVDSLSALQEQLATGSVTAVILDLNCGIAPAAVRELLGTRQVRLLAFGPHVDSVSLEAARQAGFDDVWPRSRLAAALPDWLRRLVEGANSREA